MEQTALRPKPMPGTSGNGPTSGSGRRQHAARRRGRRLIALLLGLLFGVVLLLSGTGLGTVSATVIGMSRLADLQKQAGAQQPGARDPGTPGTPGAQRPGQPTGAEPSRGAASSAADIKAGTGAAPSTGARATLGVEAVDAPDGAGALLVGIHVPGPGHAAGLVRGDVLVAFGGTAVGSAADLAAAVAAARPGAGVSLKVRHENGVRQVLSAIPGFVT
ncbi:PDZ domain-containing protein [Streptomyces sp. NPDC091292]|uniref:PDZ domain-containing protein n=1 Tax=Streptomyces sp. NPDC091292 TaxID=3365991 RepID=UPI003823FB3C